jgi:hypothetical protein
VSSAGPGAGGRPEAGGHGDTHGDNSPWIGSIGDYTRLIWNLTLPLLHVAWLPVSVCLVIAATISFAVFAVAQWPGGPQLQYVWFYVLAALALLIAGAAALYPAGRTGQTRDAAQQAGDIRRRRMARTILVGTAALCCGGSALAWVDVDRTGEVGVEMTIQGTQPVDKPGGTLEVHMTRPASGDVRDKLRLTLTIIDDDPSTPTCVGRTTATITVVTPGITPNAREVPAQSTVDFDLGGRRGAVKFAVHVWSETGCSMRLAQARGTLHDS